MPPDKKPSASGNGRSLQTSARKARQTGKGSEKVEVIDDDKYLKVKISAEKAKKSNSKNKDRKVKRKDLSAKKSASIKSNINDNEGEAAEEDFGEVAEVRGHDEGGEEEEEKQEDRLIWPFDATIFLGDLNYRVDLPRLEVRVDLELKF